MEEQFMERVVKFLKDAEVFYFKNATATFSAFTHDPKVVKLGQKLWMINFKAQKKPPRNFDESTEVVVLCYHF